MKERITVLAVVLVSMILCLPRQIVAETEASPNPYSSILLTNGITPNAKGVAEYIERIRPSPETTRKVARHIEELGASSYRTRQKAQDTLASMGLVAEHAIREAATSDDPEISMRAAAILKDFSAAKDIGVLHAAIKITGLTKPKNAVSLLFDVLPLCSSRFLRAAASESLLLVVTPKDRKHLDKALKSKNILVRIAAIAPLSSIMGDDDRSELRAFLKDPHPLMKFAAAHALVDHGDRASLATLADLLSCDSLEARGMSASVLRQLTRRHFGYAAYADREDRAKAARAWRDFLAKEGETVKLHFPLARFSRRSWLNGNTLLAYGYKHQVIELDPSGATVWSYEAKGVWSAEKMPNGNVLVAAYSANSVQEVNRKGDVVWQYNINCLNAKPLLNGNILVADYSGSRAVEISKQKNSVVWEYAAGANCSDVQRLPSGNTLVATQQRVVEITPAGKTVWEWSGGRQIYSAQRLLNRNTLITCMSNNKVYEISPEGKTVWELDEPQPCDAFRLPNGNTLITTAKRFLEVTPDKKTVWSKEGSNYGTARK